MVESEKIIFDDERRYKIIKNEWITNAVDLRSINLRQRHHAALDPHTSLLCTRAIETFNINMSLHWRDGAFLQMGTMDYTSRS